MNIVRSLVRSRPHPQGAIQRDRRKGDNAVIELEYPTATSIKPNNKTMHASGRSHRIWMDDHSRGHPRDRWRIRAAVRPDGGPDGSVPVQSRRADGDWTAGGAKPRRDGGPDGSVAVQAEPLMVTGPLAGQSRSGMEAPMAPVSGRGSAGWKQNGPSRRRLGDGWKQMARPQCKPRRCGTLGYCRCQRARNHMLQSSGVRVQRNGCLFPSPPIQPGRSLR